MSGKDDNTAIMVIGGLALLYFWSRSNPANVAAQQVALQDAAALQQQNIQTAANMQNVQTGANLIQNLVGDFAY